MRTMRTMRTRIESLSSSTRTERQSGWLLVEAMVALTVLSVGILGFVFSFQANFRATREIGNRDRAQVALESVVENLRTADFADLYDTYEGTSFDAPGLKRPDGQPALVLVSFDLNETTLAREYGPLMDIDGDGVKTNSNVSPTSYVLLPTRVSVIYQMNYGVETKTLFLVLGAD